RVMTLMDDDIEALRDQTQSGDHLDEAANDEQTAALRDAIRTELDAIDHEGRQKTVSVWDGPMAVLIAALEDNPKEFDRVATALQHELDVDHDDPDRSDLLRMALRLGFATAAPETIDATRDAVRDHASKNL
ncbi:MAG: hypothetical protein ABEI52_10860, partial [Halobacteriaceae archaeon]